MSCPLYEAKMIHQFDHRFGERSDRTATEAQICRDYSTCYEQLPDPTSAVRPRYWVLETDAVSVHELRTVGPSWLLGWRDITR